MTAALVTGGAGFIGSHVAELLVERGYEVTVFDDLSQGNVEWVPEAAKFIMGDIMDVAALRAAMRGKGVVFHLAAMSRVLPSLTAGPMGCAFSAQQNILGTVNVLAEAARAEVGKVIYSSSSTVYGCVEAPQKETDGEASATPYAVSKYGGELYARLFWSMYGLKTACLRYFQVYGPRQPVEGEYATVAGIFLDQKKRGVPLTIHGDGSQRRDFVHVEDVAMANLLAYEKDVNGVVNIGTGRSHSIKELADMISPRQVALPERKFDLKETEADTDRCLALLDWLPRRKLKTEIERMLHA